LRAPDPLRLTWLCILVLGAGLLLDGALLLALNASGLQVPGIDTTDARQNLLHLISGVVLVAVALRSQVRAMWAALVFGAFYVALGVLGLTIERPFGLDLGPGENTFHFTVGPLALLLGAWALRTASAVPPQLRTAARQAQLRNAPATPRRARRRPGKARGHQRRR